MASVDFTRFGDLCRLCASKTNEGLGINIFEGQGASREIEKKIQTCLPFQVHEIDELPKMICENCIYKLDLFSEFRERSVLIQSYLMNLYKELSAVRMQSKEMVQISHAMNIAVIDHPELIMVQPQHMMNDHSMQNVPDLDLNHLNQRGMVVGHEIILPQHNMDMAHTLDNININHQNLSNQDLSNHSLQAQNGILVDEDGRVHQIQENEYAETNLELVHQEHHMVAEEQYRIHHNMQHVEIAESGVPEMHITDNAVHMQEEISNPDSHISQKQEIQLQTSPPENNDSNPEFKYQCTNSQSFNEDMKIETHENSLDEKLVLQSVTMGSNENNIVCIMCKKSFDDKYVFQEHYQQHFNKCVICLAMFTNREALNAHRKEVHGSSLQDLQWKENEVKSSTTFSPQKDSVPLGDESIEESDDANDNDELLQEEDEIVDQPQEVVNNSGNNGTRRKKWSPKVCTECGKSYKTNYKLMEHMRKHTGEKPYKCSSCEKAFRSKIGLAQHEAQHTGQYEYSCPTCGKGFQCKSYLMVHQRVHSDIKPYPCTTCGQNFKTKQSLLDHTNRHLGVKPYMCEICGRGFITKGLCRAHQKVHTGLDNRKFSCKVCNKMFVSKSYLQTHLKIHTGEKPFVCEVCNKGFLTRVDLRIHMTMHTGEKRYVCEMCGKAFARRDALRCHRRSHTGERPYCCDQCGQTFTQFSPMAIHKRLHTGERPYVCEVCGKKFVSKSTMMAHCKKHDR